MTTPTEYRAKAAECDRQAVEAADPWTRQQLRRIAADWRLLAEQAEASEALARFADGEGE